MWTDCYLIVRVVANNCANAQTFWAFLTKESNYTKTNYIMCGLIMHAFTQDLKNIKREGSSMLMMK